jgi:hypothetical protein
MAVYAYEAIPRYPVGVVVSSVSVTIGVVAVVVVVAGAVSAGVVAVGAGATGVVVDWVVVEPPAGAARLQLVLSTIS